MGQKEKHAYLAEIQNRYRKTRRKQKSIILQEFCSVCKYNRKYAIRLLNRSRKKKTKQKRGRKPIYDQSLLIPLKRIWFAAEQVCSKRLTKVIQLWLPYYEIEYGKLSPPIKTKLQSVSAATIDRLLKPTRAKQKRKGLCGTKPGRLLKNIIPIKTLDTLPDRPGFLEADTVAHCGNSLAGDFVWSLCFTDVYSTWTENRAIWNKGAQGVVAQVNHLETTLPFPILGFAVDNGREFLNYHLLSHFKNREAYVAFTRSRPYNKNDNARVEEKNWTHVRQLLGYDRLDKPQLLPLINDLYATWSLYQNHFLPTFKLVEKIRVNARYQKTYDEVQTPYQRLISSNHLQKKAKRRLQSTHRPLNPFHLKKLLEQKLNKIFNVLRLPHS